MSIDAQTLISRMEWAAAHGLAEFVFSLGKTEVSIRLNRSGPSQVSPMPDFVKGTPTVADNAILAPLTGVCHLSPGTGGPQFINVGARVEVGQTICVIEAMKVMTAVPATRSGTVEAVLVSDGSQISAGTPLVSIR